LEYKFVREDVVRRRDEALQSLDALQREELLIIQQRCSPVKSHHVHDPDTVDNEKMQVNVHHYPQQQVSAIQRRHQPYPTKEQYVERAVRYRGNLHNIIQSRATKPIVAPVSVVPLFNL
jgi:hypothetical protein